MNWVYYVKFILIFGLGIAIGLWVDGSFSAGVTSDQIGAIRSNPRDSNYKFINPLLACEVYDKQVVNKYKILQDSLQKIVDQEIKKGNATNVSVYFLDPLNGNWASINSDKNLCRPV